MKNINIESSFEFILNANIPVFLRVHVRQCKNMLRIRLNASNWSSRIDSWLLESDRLVIDRVGTTRDRSSQINSWLLEIRSTRDCSSQIDSWWIESDRFMIARVECTLHLLARLSSQLLQFSIQIELLFCTTVNRWPDQAGMPGVATDISPRYHVVGYGRPERNNITKLKYQHENNPTFEIK